MKASLLILLLSISWSKSTTLFNGKDLTGWDTYLPETGLNNDPDKVFSVVEVDGAPAIRISGQHFGGVSTKQEYANYHLRLQFKWGTAKWAPRLNNNRDSGLLYHGTGEHGVGDGFWLRSQEFQVQEGDCGDYWGVAGGAFDIPVKKDGKNFVYDPKGEMMTFTWKTPNDRHVVKFPDAEKPSGEWNTLDLYCFGDSAIHVVNGKVVMRLYKSNVTKGKIQLQSEGAEVFYRNLELTELTQMPDVDN
jgi:hypothetical protein